MSNEHGKRKHRRAQRIATERMLRLAGITIPIRSLLMRVMQISFFLALMSMIAIQIFAFPSEVSIIYRAIMGLFILLCAYPIIMLLCGVVLYVYVDLRIASRRSSIEKVLPEFLQLTAANIRAGMPIDQALWSAVRPHFGVLSKEIEDVAKQTMTGSDLAIALTTFSHKYDSKMLRRSVSLIVEGINAGSEIGDLVENLAISIQDMQIRKESMAANVTTYIIFIAFAVLFAAPLLFAVSVQMLRVIHKIGDRMTEQGAGDAVAGITLTLSSSAVNETHFFIFCILSLCVTAIMSTIIMAAIKSGHPRDALKQMPLYIGVSVTLFFIAQWILGNIFSGLL